MARKRDRSPEEMARREKIRELLQLANVGSMDDIHELFKETIGEFMENGLEAELDEELGYSKYDYRNKATDNSRNGHSSKKLKASYGEIEIETPRDRKGEFEPQLIKKNQTSVSQDVENKILSMYAKGMTTGDIETHIRDAFGGKPRALIIYYARGIHGDDHLSRPRGVARWRLRFHQMVNAERELEHDVAVFICQHVRRGVLWGMQLTHASSWQIELSRRDNGLSISGGLADADYGHWMKRLAPKEVFAAPEAWVTVCRGDIDDVCGRLVDGQSTELMPPPAVEEQLPVVFNEWCTSWGCPDAVQMEKLTRRLEGWPVRYLVMDAGWYKGSAHEWHEMTGDWIPSSEKYPEGLKAVCDRIREAGFIPGIWFEIETCGVLSQAWLRDGMLLKRHGLPLVSKARKFWDFRDRRVWDYMCERVIGLMKEAGIGYIKVDSNESIGVGCDGAESLGEGLRQQIEAVRAFFVEMRRQIPDLVIENCSSGGHRLVSSFMNLSSMASFSDAFETEDIPVIAANLHRVIQPRQSQVWCIVRKAQSEKELYYKLAAGFLGRIGLSGDIYDLSDAQCRIIRRALDKYRLSADVIRDGFSRRFGEPVFNYRRPEGWQAVAREGRNGTKKLVVVHRFHEGGSRIVLPIGEEWTVDWSLKRDCVEFSLVDGELKLILPEELEAAVIMLEKR